MTDELEEIKARRAARAAATEEARAAQYLIDCKAIEALEAEHGYVLNISQQVRQFVPGCPVVVAVKAPSELEYKRFFQQINRSKGNADAQMAAHAMLAQVCWVYPENPEARKAMVAANGGLLASVGNLANKLAELNADEEGKG